MTTLNLQIPAVGLPDSTEEPKVASDLTTISTWANGSIDGTNVAATLTGRRLIGQWGMQLPGGLAASSYLFTAGGLPALYSSTNSGTLSFVYLDPANHAVTGKNNTTMVLRMSLAVNGTAPAANFTGYMAAIAGVTGGSGLMGFTLGGAYLPAAVPGGFSGAVTVAEASAPFPPIGPYAPQVVTSAPLAAASMTAITIQLYVQNS